MTQLFSVEDAARLLAISPWTVRDLVRKGKLSPVRVGRRLLLDEETLNKFVDESRKVDSRLKNEGGVLNETDR
jgi:excisionase family DNA binding protein